MTTTVSTAQPAPAPAMQRGPNGWLVIGGVLTAATLVLGVLSAAGWLSYRTEVQHQVYEQQSTDITVDIDTGNLTLTAGDPGTVTVTRRLKWAFAKPTVQEHWDGQSLQISSTCTRSWPGPGCAVDYTIEVPEGVAVRASTSTGDITVRNLRGQLRLSTSTGDIHGSDLASANVEAQTDTGDIVLRLTSPARAVSTRTSTGDIEIVVPGQDGYRVETRTGTGDVDVLVRRDDASQRSIAAHTGTGDIDVRYG